MRRKLQLKPKKSPTQARARATYASIVEAATRILVRTGYEDLTTNGVALEAGIGIASLYEYFPNKQAVVAEVVTQTVEGVIGDIERALERALGDASLPAIAPWIAAMFEAIDKRKRLVAVIVGEVPFLWEVPAMRAARSQLLLMAERARTLHPHVSRSVHGDALTYLLPVMIAHAIVDVVLRPPPTPVRADIERALVAAVNRLVFSSF